MFSQVFASGPRGECLPLVPGVWQTPPGRHPQGRHAPGQTPPWVETPLYSACWDTVNKWAVRIPLECILVTQGICLQHREEFELKKKKIA